MSFGAVLGGTRAARTLARAVPQVTLFTKPGCTLCDKALFAVFP